MTRSDGATVCGASTLITTRSCSDTTASPGTPYTYTVVAVYGTWTAAATSGSASAGSADGSGTMTATPTSVSASSTANTITLTYTAATGGLSNGTVAVAVPPGWSAPSATSSANGYTTASTGTVSLTGQTITISGVTLAGGATLTITYGNKSAGGPGATAPSTTGAQTWTTQEKSTSGGTLTNLASSPSITVGSAPAADGSGTMTASPTGVSASSTANTITLTYTAATGGLSNGTVVVAVPTGWSTPATTSSAAGYITASTGTVSTLGQTITVSGVSLTGGATLTITYGDKSSGGPGATAPSTTGAQTWTTQEKSTSGGTLTNLASSPSITVAAAATKLVFTQQPSLTGTGGTAFATQPKVAVETAGGAIVTTDTSNVTLTITSGTGTSGAALSCTANPVSASGGVATFSGCSIDKAGVGYTLTATDGSLTSATSTGVTVTVGAAKKLAFTQQPSSTATHGVVLPSQPTVAIEDAGGNTVTTDISGVTLTLNNPGGVTGAQLTCTLNPVLAVLGVSSFSGCKISSAGSFSLTATDGTLTSATSNGITVS